MKLTKEIVLEHLEGVMDPELNMSIVDLGLIYDVETKENHTIKITMTLTTLGCPLFDTIKDDISNKLTPLDLKEDDIEINLTFDPPWSMERMSERAKAMLGI